MLNALSPHSGGIYVDGTSSGTVVEATLYENEWNFGQYVSGTGLGSNPIRLQVQSNGTTRDLDSAAQVARLFVDEANGNFTPEGSAEEVGGELDGSEAIDSSKDEVTERPAMSDIRLPLGIPDSPIWAPDYDMYEQKRAADFYTQPSGGVGQNVFKDRGAIDRSDFAGPTAAIVDPQDNDTAGVDHNSLANQVTVVGVNLTQFVIQLLDNGLGMDDSTLDNIRYSVGPNRVDPNKVVRLSAGGAALALGTDYTYSYDTINKRITLTPVANVWDRDTTYKIELNPDGDGQIRDLQRNILKANQSDGTTTFLVAISGYDYGDAPDGLAPPALYSSGYADGKAHYPTLLASDGARHIVVSGFYLGAGINSEDDAKISAAADLANGVGCWLASGCRMRLAPRFEHERALATLDVLAEQLAELLRLVKDAWVELSVSGDLDMGGQDFVKPSFEAVLLHSTLNTGQLS